MLTTFGPNEDFVRKLLQKNARFLIVGSLAIKFYAPERQVNDLDILIDSSLENAQKIVDVLLCEPALFRPDFTAEQLARPKKIQIQVKIHYYLDILTPGPELDFSLAYDAGSETMLGASKVRIASIKTLKELLAGSDDPRHLRDLQLLEAAETRKKN